MTPQLLLFHFCTVIQLYFFSSIKSVVLSFASPVIVAHITSKVLRSSFYSSYQSLFITSCHVHAVLQVFICTAKYYVAMHILNCLTPYWFDFVHREWYKHALITCSSVVPLVSVCRMCCSVYTIPPITLN